MIDGAFIPPAFWTRARSAGSRLLMLDYDGTLVPHRIDRAAAAPTPIVLDRLRRIAGGGGTSLAVVSGRTVEELEHFLQDVPACLIGEHGWEQRRRDGVVRRHPLPPGAREALDRAARLARDRPWAGRLEVKRASILLHTRGLPEHETMLMERECAALWEETTLDDVVRLRSVRGGLELRACGRNKGTAVTEMIDASPPGTLPIFVGDEETDEDAFAALRETGFGILIAAEARATMASGRLLSPAAVTALLGEWIRIVEGA
jgi:trehalose-phosphatase